MGIDGPNDRRNARLLAELIVRCRKPPRLHRIRIRSHRSCVGVTGRVTRRKRTRRRLLRS
uniref:Uncharacterized protein n=1 Tax=Rhizophora mucronata TaxID=61149 RepID=A0A2P2J5E3_RHIMU